MVQAIPVKCLLLLQHIQLKNVTAKCLAGAKRDEQTRCRASATTPAPLSCSSVAAIP